MWANLRGQGLPICSTWIDEAGPGETCDWGDLWRRCLSEAAGASVLILYADEGDKVLRGALVELGAALAAGVPVFYVGPDEVLGNVLKHPGITRFGSLQFAVREASRIVRKYSELPTGDSK